MVWRRPLHRLDDLAALGFVLPASARQWAQRPLPTLRPAVRRDPGPIDNSWIMLGGQMFFVAGYTPGGVPYGTFDDEMGPYDDLF